MSACTTRARLPPRVRVTALQDSDALGPSSPPGAAADWAATRAEAAAGLTQTAATMEVALTRTQQSRRRREKGRPTLEPPAKVNFSM